MNWVTWVVRAATSLLGISLGAFAWAQTSSASAPGQAASTPQQMTTTIVIGAAVLSVVAVILALVTRPRSSARE